MLGATLHIVTTPKSLKLQKPTFTTFRLTRPGLTGFSPGAGTTSALDTFTNAWSSMCLAPVTSNVSKLQHWPNFTKMSDLKVSWSKEAASKSTSVFMQQPTSCPSPSELTPDKPFTTMLVSGKVLSWKLPRP